MYKEVSFQSIFALRGGASLPQKDQSISQIAKRAETNTLISKILTTIFIVAFGLSVFISPITGPEAGTPKEFAMAGGITAFFAALLFLMAIMGLQVTTSFISSRILDVLGHLPLSRSEISNIAIITFIRIFDIPLLAALFAFPVIYAIQSGSVVGSFISFIGIAVTEIFALTLTIGLARFFYSRVLRGGGSMGSTILRFIFLIVWILPTLGVYLVINLAGQITTVFASIAQTLQAANYIALIYPFSFSLLMSDFAFPGRLDNFTIGLSATASVGYVILGAYCFMQIGTSIRRVVSEAEEKTATHGLVLDLKIHPARSWLGIIRKDLRIASRSPAYASLFLLPVIQTVVLMLSFLSLGYIGLNVALGMLLSMSFVSLMLPPTLLAIEGLASSYTRSLPLRRRTIIAAKAVVTTLIYAMSLLVLLLAAVFLRKDFNVILTFGAVHVFSVAAASMLVLSTFVKKLWEEGFAMGNIYARLGTFIRVLLPGVLIALAPIIAASVAFFLAQTHVLTVFFTIAFLEFVIMAIMVLRR